MSKVTFGLIFGNRNFFPDKLVEEARKEFIKILEDEGFEVVVLSEKDTKLGAVETWQDAKKCAELFKKNADKIDGIVVTLPNFGDEKGVADTIRMSGLDVPVLVHAYPDDLNKFDLANRRDSFCGKISVCNNLVQYKIPFTLTSSHTVDPKSEEFKSDLRKFAGVCRVVKGMKNIRVGAIGARPNAFNTVRYSEKILEDYGISVQTIDLSEVFAVMTKLDDNDSKVLEKLKEIKSYINVGNTPEKALIKIAKFGIVVNDWIKENDIVATAIQCWTSIQQNIGVMPCTIMSMLSNSLLPSACEVDITGALSMYALQLASQTPSAIVDWNNNYGDDPDKTVLFHCSNFPVSLMENLKMGFGDIISGSVGVENAYGTCVGKIKKGPLTFARLTTDDTYGTLRAYVGEGEITNETIDTFGGYGVAKINNLQELLKFICQNGFEHHVAINLSNVAQILNEAFTNYLGIETYLHT